MCEIFSKLTLKALSDVINIFLEAFCFSKNFILCPDIVIDFDVDARIRGVGRGLVISTPKMNVFRQKLDAIWAKYKWFEFHLYMTNFSGRLYLLLRKRISLTINLI